jgi:phosphatidylserine decarboxylase
MTRTGDRRRPGALALGTPWWARTLALGLPASTLVALRTCGRTRAAATVLAAAGAVTAAFFRDPDRSPGVGLVLAPADGVVSAVDRQPDGRVRVATFMRLTDVHVNRAPMDGVVREQRRRPGRHRPAFRSDADLNEQMEWTIDTHLGELRLVQIAGALGRRIVPYRSPGERIVRGERIGIIRFGSRVDVILPTGMESQVRVGERVRAGVTRLDRP